MGSEMCIRDSLNTGSGQPFKKQGSWKSPRMKKAKVSPQSDNPATKELQSSVGHAPKKKTASKKKRESVRKQQKTPPKKQRKKPRTAEKPASSPKEPSGTANEEPITTEMLWGAKALYTLFKSRV